MRTHREIAEQLLGEAIGPDGYVTCPGAHLHTTGTGQRDFRLWLDPENVEMPREHCFHASCQAARDAFMRSLWSAIAADRRGLPGYKPQPLPPRRAAAPRAEKATFDAEFSAEVARACPVAMTPERLRRISPIMLPSAPENWPDYFLDKLYRRGERVLIFDDMRSQGQYLREIYRRNYRLNARPGIRASKIEDLPLDGGELGMWFLCAPVTGAWLPNRNSLTKKGEPRLGRRHADCVTVFRYAVLESDTVPPADWLNILGQLMDPIAAIYTSGKKSIHALVYLGELKTAAEFNMHRQHLLRRLVPLGADPAALTPVRLTRLPGATRAGQLQRLLYLNPAPLPGQPLYTLPLLRK